MANFKQICRIKTDYNSKKPEVEVRQGEKGTSLVGKLQWLDGKKQDGKPDYTWFNFRTSKEELMNIFLENQNATFEVEGFIKNRNWEVDGVWKNKTEILISKVSIYEPERKPATSFHEKEESEEDKIPF